MQRKLVGIVACLLFSATSLAAQGPSGDESQQTGMMERMRQMMEMRRQQMQEERTALVAELNASRETLAALVEEMNSAEGSSKTEAIAAVVSELVAQHGRILDMVEAQPGMMRQMQMMEMMGMMQQMMQGMQAGDAEQDAGEHQH